MSELKWIEKEFKGHETFDGAGVKLKRIFGGPNSYLSTDPFLLLDGNFIKNEKPVFQDVD